MTFLFNVYFIIKRAAGKYPEENIEMSILVIIYKSLIFILLKRPQYHEKLRREISLDASYNAVI